MNDVITHVNLEPAPEYFGQQTALQRQVRFIDKAKRVKNNLRQIEGNLSKETPSIPQPKAAEPIQLLYTPPDWSLPPTTPYYFEVVESGIVVDKIKLSIKGHLLVGRLPLCDIIVDDATCSRQHSVLQFRLGDPNEITGVRVDELYIYDLGSTSGTYVNQIPLTPLSYYPLISGDLIQFGQFPSSFILRQGDFIIPKPVETSLPKASNVQAKSLIENQHSTQPNLQYNPAPQSKENINSNLQVNNNNTSQAYDPFKKSNVMGNNLKSGNNKHNNVNNSNNMQMFEEFDRNNSSYSQVPKHNQHQSPNNNESIPGRRRPSISSSQPVPLPGTQPFNINTSNSFNNNNPSGAKSHLGSSGGFYSSNPSSNNNITAYANSSSGSNLNSPQYNSDISRSPSPNSSYNNINNNNNNNNNNYNNINKVSHTNSGNSNIVANNTPMINPPNSSRNMKGSSHVSFDDVRYTFSFFKIF